MDSESATRTGEARVAIWHLVLILALGWVSSLALEDRGFYTLDEGSLLSISQRIVDGEVLYRDVCSAIYPGIYYLLAAAFRLFGSTIAVERRVATFVLLAMIATLYLLGRRATTPRLALAGTLCFIGVRPALFPLYAVLNYSQVAQLLGFVTLLVISGRTTTGRVAATGALTAATGLFKQNYGFFLILVVLTLIALRRQDAPRRRGTMALIFLASGAGTTLPAVLALLATGALPEAWRNTMVGPLLVVPGAYVVPWAPLIPLAELGLAPRIYLPSTVADIALDWIQKKVITRSPLLVPVAIKLWYLAPLFVSFAVLLLARRRRNVVLAVSAVFNLLLYVGIFPRTDFSHLTIIAPLAALHTIALLAALGGTFGRAAVAAAVASSLALGVGFTVMIRTAFDAPLVTPRGTIRMSPDATTKMTRILAAIERHVPRDAPLFVAPVDSSLFYFSGRRNPTRFDYLEPVNVGTEQARATVERLEAARIEWIVYSDRDLRDTKVPPLSEFAPELHDYLLGNFEPLLADMQAFDELYLCRRRQPRPPPAIDLLDVARHATLRDGAGAEVDAAADSTEVSEFLGRRVLEMATPEQPGQALVVRLPVTLPNGTPRFTTTLIGRTETWWTGTGPGLYLRVAVEADGTVRPLFETFFDPAARNADRRGRALDLDLEPWAGRAVTIVLEAQSGVVFEVEGMGFAEPAIQAGTVVPTEGP